jgi:hypothetical protein
VPNAPYFRRTSTFSGFDSVFSGNATAAGTVAAPVSLYVAGLITKDLKMKGTAMLAEEAVADSEIWQWCSKIHSGAFVPPHLRRAGIIRIPGLKAEDRFSAARLTSFPTRSWVRRWAIPSAGSQFCGSRGA